MNEEKKKIVYRGPLFQTVIPGFGVVTRDKPFETTKELAKTLVEKSAGFEYVKKEEEKVEEVKKNV